MKNENQFNSELSKHLRSLHPELFHVKLCDRFSEGLSDFITWKNGKTMAIEVKFIKKFPSDKAQLLTHPFSGAQRTFLQSMFLSGNKGYGFVVVDDLKLVFIIEHDNIPIDGNWNTSDFKMSGFKTFPYWNELLGFINE